MSRNDLASFLVMCVGAGACLASAFVVETRIAAVLLAMTTLGFVALAGGYLRFIAEDEGRT